MSCGRSFPSSPHTLQYESLIWNLCDEKIDANVERIGLKSLPYLKFRECGDYYKFEHSSSLRQEYRVTTFQSIG